MYRMGMTILGIAALTLAGCGQTTESTVDPGATAPASTTASAEPARPRAASLITVPAGTFLEVSLNETLNSGSTGAGEHFTARVNDDVMINGMTAIPAGSTVSGTVREVVPAKRGAGNAKMTLAFTNLDLPGGYATALSASLSQSTASKKKRNATVIGGSAAGGALLGRLIGKDTKGAVVGAIVGGGIGTGVVMSKEGAQVNLPAGADLTIQLDEALKVPR